MKLLVHGIVTVCVLSHVVISWNGDGQDGVLKSVNCMWKESACTPRRGSCGRGTMTKTLIGVNCPSESKQARCRIPCAPGEKRKSKKNKMSPNEAGLVGLNIKKLRGGLKITKDCVYDKGEWSKCNPVTMKVTRVLTLQTGDPSLCKERKRIRKPCGFTHGQKKKNKKMKLMFKKNCVYSRGAWTPCNPTTKLQSRTVKLVKGRSRKCPVSKTVARRCMLPEDQCRNRRFPEKCKARLEEKMLGCKYSKGNWLPCDPKTNIKTRILSLLEGDPVKCVQTKNKTKKCKIRNPCKYNRGKWVGCDDTTSLKTRVDTLKGDSAICNATRVVSKPCKPKDFKKTNCQYRVKEWGECDSDTNLRNVTKSLVDGDKPECSPTKVIPKPCKNMAPNKRCVFGKFGKFKQCQNGVKTKTRRVISGPPSCQRRAVKTKPCGPRRRMRKN